MSKIYSLQFQAKTFNLEYQRENTYPIDVKLISKIGIPGTTSIWKLGISDIWIPMKLNEQIVMIIKDAVLKATERDDFFDRIILDHITETRFLKLYGKIIDKRFSPDIEIIQLY